MQLHNKAEKNAINAFFDGEIGKSASVLKYYLQWLSDDENINISGNSFFLEKREDRILIGNLFDEGFSEILVDKTEFVNFLNEALNLLK